MANNTRRVECMECGHAQTIRVRKGYTWRCRKCKTVNPGPGMLASLFRQRIEAASAKAPPTRRRSRPPPVTGRDPATGRFLPAAANGNGGPPAEPAASGNNGTPPARRRAQLGSAQQTKTPPARARSAGKGDTNGAADAGTKSSSSGGLAAAARRVWHGS